MLQVKDPQEVFDMHIKAQMQASLEDPTEEISDTILNSAYSIFVLGEMYGTISTCLAQNIPIPKELWDMPVVRSFVRGDLDKVTIVENSLSSVAYSTVRGDLDDVVVVDKPLTEAQLEEIWANEEAKMINNMRKSSHF